MKKTQAPPKVTVTQFKDWWNRRVAKPLKVPDKVLRVALKIGNKRAEMEALHRQKHKKEKTNGKPVQKKKIHKATRS